MTTTTHKKGGKGDCFERSYHLLVDGKWKGQGLDGVYFGEPKLCQGIVYHEKRGYHIHGWIEDDLFAYDFISDRLVSILKDRYYFLGKIKDKPRYLARYTKAEAMQKVVDTDLYYFSDLIRSIKVKK